MALNWRTSAVLPALLVLAMPPASQLTAVAADAPTCFGVPATIIGTDGDDDLVGTDGADVIASLGGNDEVHPGDGDDLTLNIQIPFV